MLARSMPCRFPPKHEPPCMHLAKDGAADAEAVDGPVSEFIIPWPSLEYSRCSAFLLTCGLCDPAHPGGTRQVEQRSPQCGL